MQVLSGLFFWLRFEAAQASFMQSVPANRSSFFDNYYRGYYTVSRICFSSCLILLVIRRYNTRN